MWLILFLFVIPALAHDHYKVNTTQGLVIGLKATDGDYATFYGIHYGGSTAGENRFKAPTEPPKYTGDFNATNSGVICAQPSPKGIIGTEDCLVLNIFTKNLTSPKPVFVWLEGEEYKFTTNMPYSYKILVQEDVLVVSMNYRLSIFGFLCLGVPEAPGNAGLKDVIQGLKWIKQNIAAFGGDPKNVMLAGYGSGAAMVDLITLSPLSKNLIHKVLVLSGSGLASWAVAYDPIGYAQKVGEKMGYKKKSPSELAKLLSTSKLEAFNSTLTEFEFYNNTPLFAPCVENVKLSGTLLHDAPINILRSKNYTDVPYIAGFTDKEGTMRAEQAKSKNWLTEMQNHFEKFLPVDLSFKNNSTVKTNVSLRIKKKYFDEKVINKKVNNGTMEEFFNYQGDILVLIPIIRGAYERALTSNSSVFIFEYAVNGSKQSSIRTYLFDSNSIAHDKVIAFAQTGSPNLKDTSQQWKPVNKTLDTPITSVNIVGEEKISLRNNDTFNFWNGILKERYQAPKPVSSAESLASFGLILLLTQMLVNLLSMS